MLDEAAAEFDRAGDDWGLALVLIRADGAAVPRSATRTPPPATAPRPSAVPGSWTTTGASPPCSTTTAWRCTAPDGCRPRSPCTRPRSRTAGGALTNTVPYVLADMGHIALQLGDLDRAAQHLAEAHVVARQLGADGSAGRRDRGRPPRPRPRRPDRRRPALRGRAAAARRRVHPGVGGRRAQRSRVPRRAWPATSTPPSPTTAPPGRPRRAPPPRARGPARPRWKAWPASPPPAETAPARPTARHRRPMARAAAPTRAAHRTATTSTAPPPRPATCSAPPPTNRPTPAGCSCHPTPSSTSASPPTRNSPPGCANPSGPPDPRPPPTADRPGQRLDSRPQACRSTLRSVARTRSNRTERRTP